MGGEIEIHALDVKTIFKAILDRKITREEADRWAFSMICACESKNVVFIPREDEQKIWNGIQYLYGVDLMERPEIYLHTQEDIRNAMEEMFGFNE